MGAVESEGVASIEFPIPIPRELWLDTAVSTQKPPLDNKPNLLDAPTLSGLSYTRMGIHPLSAASGDAFKPTHELHGTYFKVYAQNHTCHSSTAGGPLINGVAQGEKRCLGPRRKTSFLHRHMQLQLEHKQRKSNVRALCTPQSHPTGAGLLRPPFPSLHNPVVVKQVELDLPGLSQSFFFFILFLTHTYT